MLTNRNLSLGTLVLALTLTSLQGANAQNERQDAEAALARYVERGGSADWTVERMDVRASLPKFAKRGRLLAIRRLAPSRKPKYEVLQLTGDRTVKDQVIARYLKAEQRASEMPAAEVAITPANYRFSYKGLATEAGRPAYVFQISPRKKRDGLIKGQLWLDAEVAAPLRYSGYLVKRPSIWIKRLEITRATTFSGGAVEGRLTHVTVDARLIGRAELVIEERPLGEMQSAQSINAGDGGGQQ